MSKIEYDPVKDKFSAIIKNSRFLRRLFYFLLDLFFLRSWHIRRVIKKTATPLDREGNWNMLDAGCGFGQYDRFLLSEFNHVTIDSVDVKKDYLRENETYFRDEVEKGHIRFYYADLLQFETDRTFDMAICIDVLEHIEEDVQVMTNISKHLKEGGYFLMHSPSHYSEEDGDEDDSFVGEHARPGYSKEDISDKLKKAGLKPEKVHYTYGFWGHKAWVLSVKWPMLAFNKLGLLAAVPLLVYYPVVMPFCLLMNVSDLYTRNEKGNGIYALARKA